MQQVKDIVATAREMKTTDLHLTFTTEERVATNPYKGVPQLHFDQLNVIAACLQEIKYEAQLIDIKIDTPILHLLKKKKKLGKQFARQQLLKCEDWNDWKASEFKQLELYEM